MIKISTIFRKSFLDPVKKNTWLICDSSCVNHGQIVIGRNIPLAVSRIAVGKRRSGKVGLPSI